MKTPNIVKKKVILITPPVNVHNIRTLSEPVPAITTTLNAMPPNGAKITDIILRPVLCRPLSTNNVRTDSLITNNVKKTARGLVVNRVMSTPVRPDGFTLLQTGVLMILLTVNAAPHPPLPDVRLTTASTVQVLPPALTPAVIHVINVAMTTVRQEHLKTIPGLIHRQLNAVHLVIVAKIAFPEALLIPENMSALLNAVPAMLVPTPAGLALNPFPALQPKTKSGFLLLNAAQAATNANIIQIVP